MHVTSWRIQLARPTASFVAAYVAVAMSVRFVVLWQISAGSRHPSSHRRRRGILALGKNDRQGHWIGSDVFYQTPLYPYFLALVQKTLGAGEMGTRMVRPALGSLGCGMMASGGTTNDRAWRRVDRRDHAGVLSAGHFL